MSRSKRFQSRTLRLESLQARELMAIDFASLALPGAMPTYSVDGTANNVSNGEWGSTNERFLRLAKSEYGDGVQTVSGQDRPSARVISNTLADQGDTDIISDRNLSAFVYVWGQFLDHDLSLTPTGTTERMLIPVPKGDVYFDPTGTGTATIRATRSAFDAATGTSSTNPREQVNSLSAWIDGSMVYGSDLKTSNALRTMSGGKLKIASNGMLPLNNAANFPNGTVEQANSGQHVTNDQLFAAGDVRANENIELTSLHTVFVREHNRWADRIAKANPRLNDQEIYARARSMVIAEIQSITYNEWLPAILGGANLGRYSGYNPRVNPGISNEFATAAFRFGHSLLGDDVEFLDNNGRPVADEMPLKDAFFNPTALNVNSIDSVFKYLASDPSSEFDLKVVGGVRNFLFGEPGQGGFDLASLNIQRGRDHGLAGYNDVRVSMGLPRVRSFADITRNREMQSKLQQLYGSVDKIDLWVGILAEDHLPNSSVGPTTARILQDQFERIRSGDRLWYERNFSGDLLQEIRNTKLSNILKRNTQLTNLQENVFVFNSSVEGLVFSDRNSDRQRQAGEAGLANWTVELVDSAGEVVASQRTMPDGRYRFNVQSGIRTDEYQVRVTKDPVGTALPQAAVRRFAITRGDQNLRGIDLAIPTPVSGGGGSTRAASVAPAAGSVPLADSLAITSVDTVFGQVGTRRRV